MTDIQSLIQEYKITGNKEVYRQFLNEIRSMDIIWAPVSQHTKSCYVEMNNGLPTAFIFTRQDYCEEFREKLSGAMLLVRTVANPAKLRLQMFSDFMRLGIKKIIVDSGHVYQEIFIGDMVKEAEVPEGKGRKPVKNPDIMVCANLFVQEMSRRNAAPQLRDDLIKAVMQGEFLVPANKDVKYDEAGKIENGSQISFQMIRNNQGQNFIPVYTDLIEFRKFDPKGNYAGIIVPFAGIKPLLEQAEGIIINPQGVNIPLNMKINPKNTDPASAVKHQIDRELSKNDAEAESRFEEDFTLTDDKDISADMLKEVSEFLQTQKAVKKAYVRGMIRNNKPGCLFIVDYGSDADTISLYQGIVLTAAKYVGALQVEMKEYSLPEAKAAAEGRTPFYEA